MLSAAYSEITGTCILGIPTRKYIADEFLITTMNSLRYARDVTPRFRT